MQTRTDPLRIGLLGCGRIARLYHLAILRSIEGVELAALADRDAAALHAAAAAAPNATPFDDYRDALAHMSLDAVVICLPPTLHADAAVRAFESGLHAYLEKPIATTAHDAARVVAAWQGNARVGMMGFNLRYHPAVLQARDTLDAGTLGVVRALRIVSGSAARDVPAWKRQRADGGGALLDLGSHHVDLARFLLRDEVEDVNATIRSAHSDQDVAAMTLTMRSGIIVESRATLSTLQENRFELLGDAGALNVDRMENRIEHRRPDPVWGRVARAAREVGRLSRGLRGVLAPAKDPSYALALRAFVAACATNAPVGPDPADGERSLAVLLAAETAAREGRRIRMDSSAA